MAADTSIKDDPTLARFRAALAEVYGARIERIVLYGARARGDARPDSDYDERHMAYDVGADRDRTPLMHEIRRDGIKRVPKTHKRVAQRIHEMRERRTTHHRAAVGIPRPCLRGSHELARFFNGSCGLSQSSMRHCVRLPRCVSTCDWRGYVRHRTVTRCVTTQCNQTPHMVTGTRLKPFESSHDRAGSLSKCVAAVDTSIDKSDVTRLRRLSAHGVVNSVE